MAKGNITRSDYIALRDCIDGRAYFLQSRWLKFGVFNEDTGGFTGIRSKFGSRYLFSEFHAEVAGGTVYPLKDLGETIQHGIEVRSDLGATDAVTKRRVEIVGGKGWRFSDTKEFSYDIKPVLNFNEKLFSFLKKIESKYAART